MVRQHRDNSNKGLEPAVTNSTRSVSNIRTIAVSCEVDKKSPDVA